jgi:MFS family permease
MTAVAVPKQIYDLTHSSAYVGLAGVFALVPLLIFGLWGGAIADSMDRRTLMLITNTGIAVSSAGLWLSAFVPVHSVWLVLGLLAVQQSFFAINSPARTASIPRIVPTELLPAANALSGTVMQLGAVIGPLLAGVLLQVIGLSVLYLVDTCALFITLWAVYRLPAMPPDGDAPRKAGLKSVIDGLKYLGTQKVLLASFVADLIAMVFGMPRALFPELAEKTFHDPAGGGAALGWLYAAIPLGSVAFGLLSGWTSKVKRHGVVLVVCIMVWGLSIIGFGLSKPLWLAVLFLAIGGGADLVSMIVRNTMSQSAATDDMRGRMQGVYIVIVAGGPRISDAVHGGAGAVFGTTTAIVGGGVLVLVAMAVAAVALPALWAYRVSPAGQVNRGSEQ